jgi:multidrug efflux pump subunit AcrB
MSERPPSAARDNLSRSGFLAYMADNAVAANLLMLLFLVGGLLMVPQVRQEVFPEAAPDIVTVTVAYPGASPAEVEQGVILAIEQALQGIDGVKRITATASESIGNVTVELLTGTDKNVATADVKNAVDRVTSFPLDAEEPIVSLLNPREENISVIVYGDVEESVLRHWAYEIRDDLLQAPEISDAEVTEVRPLEISIEVPQEQLRQHNLTLDAVANAVRSASVEVPGGGLRTPSGEVLVRVTERRNRGSEFETIVVASEPGGAEVVLGDIAEVVDGFRETDQAASYNGLPAARVRVYRSGDETPIDVTNAVTTYIAANTQRLPTGVEIALWNDGSEVFKDRIQLLLKNAYFGLILVLLLLGLFLEIRLAFWVTLGIPISFLGSILLMPTLDVSFNMISLFAFILTLGIVVDDAIVVGEAIYNKQQEGLEGLDAAIAGVREVAAPVIFAVLTTVIAFIPMLYVPGVSGKFMRNVPLIVIAVFALSLVESLLILPAHLAHGSKKRPGGFLGAVSFLQRKFGDFFDTTVARVMPILLRPVYAYRYASIAAGLGILIVAVSTVAAGLIQFTFLPKVEGDEITVNLRLPYGTPVATTRQWTERFVEVANEIMDENGGSDLIGEGIYASVGSGTQGTGSHLTFVSVELVPIDQRGITAAQFAAQWRERVGEIPGAEVLSFAFSTGPSAGAPISIRLSHSDTVVLEQAAERLAGYLADTYQGVTDIDSGVSPGKEQLDFTLRHEARTLGVTEQMLASQLRGAFFGVEAARQQRGRDELRVYVRRPERERSSEYFLDTMLIQTPLGGELPLYLAADVHRSQAYTSIVRQDGRRVITVTADVDEQQTNANTVIADLSETFQAQLLADTPGLRWEVGGEQEEQGEVMASLARGLGMALLAMYALIAVAFRSYLQPLIIMVAIPFGVVGALAGHLLMGYSVSLLSMFGIVALAGVVVNDTILLITTVNTNREHGMSVIDACIQGSTRRFRPILMTSLTTFLGLMPMLLETSVQARFLIPMAISLGFGVLFVTPIALIIAPCMYIVIDDVVRAARWVYHGGKLPDAAEH